MQPWTRKSDTVFELTPVKDSRFVLTVEQTVNGKWLAYVSGDEVDEGHAFVNLLSAQQAALEAYDNYWCDFDEPSDGW